MGITPLRQLLQSLCCNSPWNYAVFWKLHHQTQMLLTWEDGYCDKNCVKGSDELLPSNGESSIYDTNLGGYPIELAVAYMSSAQYALGEGVVGEVAYTGNYRWVFSDNISGGEFSSNLLSECPDELLFQFAAGIKTLFLVPVGSLGVLQFGSYEMVAEDPALVAYIKDKFITHQNFVLYSLPSPENGEFAQLLSSLNSPLMDNLHEVSALTMNEMKPGDSKAVNSFKSVHKFSTVNQSTPQSPNLSSENDIGAQLSGFIELPEVPSQSLNFDNLETMENSMFKYSDDDLQAFSYSNNYGVEVFEEYLDKTMNSYSDNNTGHTNAARFFSFPGDCELHKALGPAFMSQTNELKPPVSNGDLLKAAFDNVYCGPDESLSKTASSEKSSVTSSGQLSASSKGQKGQSERTFMFGKGKNVPISISSPSVSSCAMNPLIVEDQQQKGNSYSQPRKGSKLGNASKRRPRAGDNQRPRPRDRQLIQDRVKELRELVPNGAKCSIDGLLDRTVKHMLYLRNVTDQADKLKQSVHHDVAGWKNMKSNETNGAQQSGTSWAFELGSEQQICPIIVEDLEHTGHMLIEMMCNDHWHFLEIAEVIHRLDLTILKGEMESHLDNTWAHFIVEAPRGFHRLDIFWPLMRLLRKNGNPISSKI